MNEDVKDAATDVGAALIAGHKMGERTVQQSKDGGRPYLIDYDGDITIVEEILAAPTRIRQKVSLYSRAAFVEYLKVFASKTYTVVFARRENNSTPPSVTAVVDYHAVVDDKDAPSWCEHRLLWQLPFSSAWLAWMAINKQPISQTDFGVFLEEHLSEIAEPDGDVLIGAAVGFEATKSVSFKSAQRIEDGSVRFQYEEEVKGATQQGQIKLPKTFTIVIKPFVGLNLTVQLVARLRYRVAPTGLTLWFELANLDEKMQEFFQGLVADLRAELEGTVKAVIEGAA